MFGADSVSLTYLVRFIVREIKSEDGSQHGVPEYTKLLRAFLRISEKIEDD